MPMPKQPQAIPRPFADNGDFSIIPDTKTIPGRASFFEGFPAETRKRKNEGGVAPNGTDFNGLFRILTGFSFWQQSGGMYTYSAALNYSPPSLVFHAGKLWWCMAENGPETTAGIVAPGANEAYWAEFLRALGNMGGGGSSGIFGNPVGTVITYYGTTAPEGYFACNGASYSVTNYPALYGVLRKATLPDLRGYFVRGYDTRNTVDPDGAARAVGSVQGDAIRNITGEAGAVQTRGNNRPAAVSGAFAVTDRQDSMDLKGDAEFYKIMFDASRVVQTAAENRPKNVCLLYCIKHD